MRDHFIRVKDLQTLEGSEGQRVEHFDDLGEADGIINGDLRTTCMRRIPSEFGSKIGVGMKYIDPKIDIQRHGLGLFHDCWKTMVAAIADIEASP